MNVAYLVVPFVGGLIAMGLRLPPLVGFLAAGFALNFMGYEETDALSVIADLGVTLLLFTIGLKLNVRTLLRKEVWGTATGHMVISTAFMVGVLSLLKVIGFAALADADLRVLAILGFALSFSSTVFVVKVLEERGESRALYGRLAIGILIMQDIFAVVFITASTGELPSPWAFALFALVPLAPVMRRLLEHVGHGEMQILYGVVLALAAGYALFEFVGIKGDLGALIIGMLLAPHASAASMSRALFNMKELFLVGFFVSIGLADLPTWGTLGVASLLVVLIFAKAGLFVAIFAIFRLRRRTSFLGSLALTNYSEFGLIVAVLAGSNGWLTDDWLVTLSIAVALSFAVSAVLNRRSTQVYEKAMELLPDQDPAKLNPIDRPIGVGQAEAVVLGMGRVGRGAYDRLVEHYGLNVLGLDTDDERVVTLRDQGYTVIEADATDPDFWEKLTLADTVDIVILALPHHDSNVVALDQLRKLDYDGEIAAVVQHRDEIESIREHGADDVFHLYAGAGIALADGAAEAAGLELR
ncbi:cation:proton antiporter family protein [Hoyosella subflava]|uniref:Sodium/hydrogen exchanger n=1 Tax=Hoyosella subflava (strain DSM 45089 / JCM 17490 / NBRC 109087 / DQS3-9A1) TaxID=443218 RepID=F6EMY5_HOYSD|nr:cation:proton antiporter family protein [Hoyosella subflava]AEF42877.1 sodium/hydrogen exchanger [Hoyosella subflava DQS3-9A1]